MRNKIIAIFGVSGVGKSHLQNYLTKEYHVLPMVTHTTRAPRAGEKDGVDYHFDTVSQFKKLDLMEDTHFDGNYYGSAKNDIEEAWQSGHHVLSIVLDYKGIQAYMERLPKNVIPIYLFSDEETVVRRLVKRGTSEKDVRARLSAHQHRLNAEYNVIFNSAVPVHTICATNFKDVAKAMKKLIK